MASVSIDLAKLVILRLHPGVVVAALAKLLASAGNSRGDAAFGPLGALDSFGDGDVRVLEPPLELEERSREPHES